MIEAHVLMSPSVKLATCYFSGWEDMNIVTMSLLHISFAVHLYLCSRFHLEEIERNLVLGLL